MYSLYVIIVGLFVNRTFATVVNLASSTVEVDGISYFVPGNPVVRSQSQVSLIVGCH
jgi:hypothetical protein